ncbi:helix-turn-helix transcriptional regulator [Mycolicibacterium psychrotolerans]|nr:helix-turn-helix transcriptional regulator [Mycolicibacterium psychrotolerans]
MDSRAEVRAFLTSRRGKVTPEQAGLPAYGTRRVPGLRRGEVAMLAGVSIEYYTRLERGDLRGVSASVLDALARALQLTETEHDHLHDLARSANSTPTRKRSTAKTPAIRPSVQRIIGAMNTLPAFVQNNRFDVLLANPLGRALYSEMFADPGCQQNTTRFVFLSPAAQRFYGDWERVARGAAGALRVEAAKSPYDRELSNLIGELSTRSDTFRMLWGAQDVHVFRDGTKRFHHPVVGDLELQYESLDIPGDTALTMAVYTPAQGSPSEDALKLLASWSATTGRSTDVNADTQQ